MTPPTVTDQPQSHPAAQPPPRPPLWWRPIVAAKSPAFRERWGRRANRLDFEGVSWPEHEERAYGEIVAEARAWREACGAAIAEGQPAPEPPPVDEDVWAAGYAKR